ncbi:MAG: porin [Burkholderiales bacterium]|nr:porin [Burkholderiales bacterium]
MNKKLIALALAGAFAAPAAFAADSEVTIYGQLNGSIDNVNNGNGATAATQGIRTTIINSNSSRLGLKGSENLGDGLSAIWQIESSVNFAGNNQGGTTGVTTAGGATKNTFASRDSFVGLSSGSMGTVLVGRHDTPYKMATRGFDVFADNIADNRSLMGNGAIQFDGRQGSVLAYVTPAMSGFTGVAAYVAGAEAATVSTQTKGSAWSLAGIYGDGPLNASIAYEVHNVGTLGTGIAGIGAAAGSFAAVSSKETAWKIGAGYTFDAFTINGVYERTNDNIGGAGAPANCTAVGSNCLGHNAYYLAGKYAFGSDAVKLAYTKVGNNNTVAAGGTGAKQWAIGYDHSLSKHTTVYALYTSLKNDVNSSMTLVGGADVTVAPNGGFGSTLSALSLGLKHSF